MSLVTTSNLAKMNKDKFQKKTIKPAVYPPPPSADGFKNPQLGNSFIQNQESTIFKHPSIRNNYGFGNKNITDNFKNIQLGNSFKKNHEKTIFFHPSIKNDYGHGIPNDMPIFNFTLPDGTVHDFKKFLGTTGNVIRTSYLQPIVQKDTPYENPDYKGPENLTTWNVSTPIQQISMDWTSEADFTNPSKDQEFLNSYYTQYTRDQIRAFSGDRVDGRGFSEPHIYTDITFYAGEEGSNNGAGNTQFLGFTSPTLMGADLQRYASHLQSTRGLTFMTKKFIQQAFNQRAENGLFNPIGILASRNNILRFKSQFDFNLKNLKKEPGDSVYKQIAKAPLEFIKSTTGINVTTYQESLDAFITENNVSFLQAHGYGVSGELPLPLFNQIGAAIANIKDAGKKFADKQKEKLKNKAENTFDKFKNNPSGKLKKFVNGIEVPDTQAARAKFGVGKDLTDALPGNVSITDDTSLPSSKATQKTFVPGTTPAGRDAIPNENDVNTISLAKYKALSYGGIEEVRKGVSSIPGKAGSSGYTAKIKSSPKKSVYISYGMYEENSSGKPAGDKINKLGIISSEATENDIYNAENGKDFIPLFINILNTNETIVLRSMLSDLSEDITPNWESIEYIGRPDKQYVYKNTERKISFKVSIIPNNQKEFEIMWRKINKLTALNYPSLSKINTGGDRMVAPFVKLTLGDMIKGQAGYFDQIKANPIDNTSFSLVKGQRLPMYMEIEFTFVYVGNKIPELVHENNIESGRGQFYDSDVIGKVGTGQQDEDGTFNFLEDGFDGLA